MANRPVRARKAAAYAVDLDDSNSSDVPVKKLKRSARQRKDEDSSDDVSLRGDSDDSSASAGKGDKNSDAPAEEDTRSSDLVVKPGPQRIAKSAATAATSTQQAAKSSQRLSTPPSKTPPLKGPLVGSGSDSDDFQEHKKTPRKALPTDPPKPKAAAAAPESPIVDLTAGDSSRSKLLSSPVSSPLATGAPPSVAPPSAATAPAHIIVNLKKRAKKAANVDLEPKAAASPKKRTARDAVEPAPRPKAMASAAPAPTPQAKPAPAPLPAPEAVAASLSFPPAAASSAPAASSGATVSVSSASTPSSKSAAAAVPKPAPHARPKQQNAPSALTGVAGTSGVRRPGLSRTGIKPLHPHKT